ncbi:MAG: hypothetical protein WCG28_02115 [bacterium]
MKKTIFPKSIIIFLIILVLIFFGLVGGLVYLIRNPDINNSLISPETIVDTTNEIVPKGTYIAQKFDFEKHYNIYVNVSTDYGAAVLLLTGSEFEKVQRDPDYMPNIAYNIKGSSAVIPVEAGKYSLMILAEDQDVKYSLNVKIK